MQLFSTTFTMQDATSAVALATVAIVAEHSNEQMQSSLLSIRETGSVKSNWTFGNNESAKRDFYIPEQAAFLNEGYNTPH